MRSFRRLPPLLRVVSILGLVLPLASLALLSQTLSAMLSTSAWPADSPRVFAIASSLTLLGLSCGLVVGMYSTRFLHPDQGPFPLDSWQSQVRALVLATVLPLGALAWAVFIPLTQPGFGNNGFFIIAIAAVVSGVVSLVVFARYQAAA